MTKRAKILIFLSLVPLVLISGLILTSESVKKTDNFSVQPAKNKITALPEEDYQAQAKKIFSAYEKMTQDKNFTIEKIVELRGRLLAIKGLPAKFKELHLQFVSALDRMEDYLNQKDQQGKNTSQKIINQLKANYSWLNN